MKWQWFIFLLLTFAVPLFGQEPTEDSFRVRARLDPAEDIVVGQKVILRIDVLVDTWFSGSPKFSDIDIPGIVVIAPSSSTVNITEQIDGTAFSGISRSFLLFPQNPGDYTIPPVSVTFTPARPGAAELKTLEGKTETIGFSVTIPLQAEQTASFVTTPKFSIHQTWTPEPNEFMVGDALTRTITLTADDTVSMLLPSVKFDAIDGLSVYPDSPQLQDTADRGDYVATRTESVTYLMQTAGNYTFPEMTFYSWDIKSQAMHKKTLPGVSFIVRENPTLAAESPAKKEVASGMLKPILPKWLLIAFAAVVLLVAIGWYCLHRCFDVRSWLAEQKEHRRQSPRFLFSQFKKATRMNDPAKARRSLSDWLNYYLSPKNSLVLTDAIGKLPDVELQQEYARLMRVLYGAKKNMSWTGKKLYTLIKRHKNKIIRQLNQSDSVQVNQIVLNPST